MDRVIEFIEKFHPSSLGLGIWKLLAIIGLISIGFVLINWIVSFLPITAGNLVKRIVRRTFNFACYGLIVLIVLNAILTGDYGFVLILALITVFSKFDYLYTLYDNFVDRKINRD